MGPEIVTAARHYKNALDPAGQTINQNGVFIGMGDDLRGRQLPADEILVGTVQTRSANSHITDSAAASTAYSCASRTNNYWIAKQPASASIVPPWNESDGIVCKTILEKAKEQGYRTGVVVTSRFMHATSAGFISHTVDRHKENEIAYQAIEITQPDVIIGGGSRHLLPQNTTGSRRKDDWDGFASAAARGYKVIRTEAQYLDFLNRGTGTGNSWEPPEKCQKLLLVDALSHRPYEIDRKDSRLPSLSESMRLAIKVLQSCGQPYFMLMEASRIDHALHENDVTTAIRETLEYNKAIGDAIIPNIASDTLVVGSSDHSTGGLSLGLSTAGVYPSIPVVSYAWYPEVLNGQKASVAEGMFHGLTEQSYLQAGGSITFEAFVDKVKQHVTLPEKVRFPPNKLMLTQFDPTVWLEKDFAPMKEQLANFLAHECPAGSILGCEGSVVIEEASTSNENSGASGFKVAIGRMLANKAYVALSTRGPTSVDVNLYCYAPPGMMSCYDLGFKGNMPNYMVGHRMAEALGLTGDLVLTKWDDGVGPVKQADASGHRDIG
eukprot:CAMPEP_0172916520 /NCGR_PEP_ID=MMETSP1075-20121228/196524_1 /TAXON_ID=2916 /ORGANISM="Ceratium fusus, Strain PA161109" /LENGTH=549 /DNA_ID=CAMNT_0013775827 /DNA_START=180 /DNA_END=1829 /DNA_ORIENTATION=-